MEQTYQVNPSHRQAVYAASKSQWTITEDDEENVFRFACKNDWLGSDCYWGLRIVSGETEALGVTVKPDCILVGIAKFVDKKETGNWHGYPVASWLNNSDKPDAGVLYLFDSEGDCRKVD